MLPTLLATKLHRPRPTANLVARPRLIQRLDEGLRGGHRLFLVVAPAGYGKTTLVADWLGRIDLASAWLSLDEADNDLPRFFAYVGAALQKALGAEMGQLPGQSSPLLPQPPEAFAYPLINDLTAVDRPVLLVLDDYHLITAGPIQEAMAFLLRRAPPNLHLVVLTRADPPFPLPRLRVRERLTELRDRDLRFTPEEMAAFLNSLHRLNLASEQISALESRTEGWAAGVQLAALSLQGCSPERAAEFIRAFSGSHHYIVDYLFDEVLSRQPEEVRQFLLQTAILERMCAPLCAAVLGWGAAGRVPAGAVEENPTAPSRQPGNPLPADSRAQEILEYLERTNLFLVPLDSERRWYRYHHLFLDALQQMCTYTVQPDQVAGLHGRAGDWYWQNGFVADAIRHAQLSGQHERAAQIVEEHAWSLVRHAEFATLKRWVQALPGEALSMRPWLRIYYAWSLFFSEADAAERQLQAVEQQFQAGGGTTLPAEMQGHIAAIRAGMAYMGRDTERAVELSRRALELHPEMDAAIRSELVTALADGCLARGDFPGAAQAFDEALDLARASGNIKQEVLVRAAQGQMRQRMGYLHEAEAIFQEALQTAIRSKSPVAGQAHFCLARIYRGWNDLASARLHAERLIESSAAWGVVEALACGYLLLAAILQAQNDVPGANRAMAQASRVMDEHPREVRSVGWIGASRARLWLAQGKLDEARRWAETRGLRAGGGAAPKSEFEGIAMACILLAEGRADDALGLLAHIQGTMESEGRQGDLLEVLALRAVALQMRAETDAALAVLSRALGLARPAGHMRVFLDEGEPMATLLRLGAARWRDPDLVAYAQKVLAAFSQAESGRPAPPAEAAPGAGPIEPLSARELEVLRLVAAGRSNREIADRLVISIRTVKKHVENIHGKLGASNRTEAAARARELGLV